MFVEETPLWYSIDVDSWHRNNRSLWGVTVEVLSMNPKRFAIPPQLSSRGFSAASLSAHVLFIWCQLVLVGEGQQEMQRWEIVGSLVWNVLPS